MNTKIIRTVRYIGVNSDNRAGYTVCMRLGCPPSYTYDGPTHTAHIYTPTTIELSEVDYYLTTPFYFDIDMTVYALLYHYSITHQEFDEIPIV